MRGDQSERDGFTNSNLVIHRTSCTSPYLCVFTVVVLEFGSIEKNLKQLGNQLFFFLRVCFDGILNENLFCSLNLVPSSSFQICLQSRETFVFKKDKEQSWFLVDFPREFFFSQIGSCNMVIIFLVQDTLHICMSSLFFWRSLTKECVLSSLGTRMVKYRLYS